jgi:glucokinase
VRHYRTADHEGLQSAWRAFARDEGSALPAEAAIGVAAPIEGQVLRFMNSPWRIERSGLAEKLGLEHMLLLNDFGAIAHAVSALGEDELAPIAGPDGPFPDEGVITVLGPGTGLGVAILVRRDGRTEVIETEGSHIGFAPLNEEEQRIAGELRRTYGRASVERLVSGPGLYDIYRSLGGRSFELGDAAGLWAAALEERDPIASEALEHLVKAFGSAAGDLALAHGAMGVAISSALSRRMADHLRSPLFAGRFIAKGRYRARMQKVRVRLVMHQEPGLLGAAVAFGRMSAGS